MRKIKRQKPVPAILQNRETCKIKPRTNLLLLELGKMTNEKCAYCETHYQDPLHNDKTPEKEHFYPRKKYPNLENHWWNLFWVCRNCNRKKADNFEKLNSTKRIIPLKPDNEGKINGKAYQFEDWFVINYRNGELSPNKKNKNWKRAEWTIELFGLNSRNNLVIARKYMLKKYLKDYNIANYKNKKIWINNFSYSFYIENWLKINNKPFIQTI